jgi:hypothetical protein
MQSEYDAPRSRLAVASWATLIGPEFEITVRTALTTIICAAVTAATLSQVVAGGAQQPQYFFAWAGDGDRADNDFLAVVDLTPSNGRYGDIVTTLPVGETALWPHHTEHEFARDRRLFVTGSREREPTSST